MTSFRMLLLTLLLVAVAASTGCVGGGTSSGGAVPSAKGDVSQCTEAYTFAPAAYIIHIVSGDAVILDPLANDFQLFCDPESAAKGMEKAQLTGAVAAGDWKVYRVYGQWSEITTEVEPGVYLLNRPAPLVDWVQ